MWKTILLCALASITAGEKVSFEDYKMYIAAPITDKHVNFLEKLYSETSWFDFLKEPAGYSTVKFLVPPENDGVFQCLMHQYGIFHVTSGDNIKWSIDATMDKCEPNAFDFTCYHTLDEIYKKLNDIAEEYPNNVQVIEGGTTYEGRDIKGVKISFRPNNTGIFLEGGSNAREWMSPAVLMYVTHELLAKADPYIRDMAESYDWYIFPTINPDGYVYSHTTNRLWSKTRKPYGTCIGSDLSKNWDYKWKSDGISSSPCSSGYPGSGPFSEIETKSMSEYIRSIQDKFSAYFSFHSSSNELMYPPGDITDNALHYDNLMKSIANRGLQTPSYRRKNMGEGGYFNTRTDYFPAFYKGVKKMHNSDTGNSVGYIKSTYRKPLVWSYGLQRKYSQDGFLQPTEKIIQIGEETVNVLVDMLREAKLRHLF